MISYLDGKIILKKEKFAILDVNGVGYKIFLSKMALSKIPEIGKSLKVFCFLNVRETAIELYGFLNQKELEVFEILDKIRGIGPKAALEIASFGPLEKINEKLLEKIPGIGRKKAMAIILELSGKIRDITKKSSSAKDSESRDEAEEGLVGLGFSRQAVKEALSMIPKDIKETDQKIKEALKSLDKSKNIY